jgi:hypothetical protein
MSVPEIELYYYDGANYTTFNAPIQSISISRGRSRQFNRFESGSAVINFFDSDRKLDPLNTSSAYYGEIVPRMRFQLEADSTIIYTGVVTDWDNSYDLVGNNTASASCSDAFTVASNTVFTSQTFFDEGSCEKRINDALDVFSYSGSRNIGPGNANLGPDVVAVGAQLLDYLFNVASSDFGNLFTSADGTITFVGRTGRQPVSQLTFADDGSGVPYSNLNNQYGDELLFNRVAVSSEAGSVVVEDSTSINAFGLSVLNLSNLLNAYPYDLSALADYLLESYKDPAVRFTGLIVELAGLSSSDVDDVLALDLADQVSVKKSFDVGDPSSVTQDLIVSGIRHSIRPGSHIVEFSFEPTPYIDAFILDDAVDGILNTDVLG